MKRKLITGPSVALDCGCTNHYGGDITFCSLHKAAPELLIACVYALNELEHPHPKPENVRLTIQELKAAIAKAEGE